MRLFDYGKDWKAKKPEQQEMEKGKAEKDLSQKKGKGL